MTTQGGHGHGHGHLGRADGHDGDDHQEVAAWARLKHLIAPHSHDSSDRVDNALETSRQGMRTLWISFAVLLVTGTAQAVIFMFTGSVALLGDTIHNLADALTAAPLALAFWVGRRAANRRYTYGYGRAEDLAGIVVVLLIAASATLAAYEAFDRLRHPQTIDHLWAVALAGVIGFIGNELVAQYRIRVGRQIGSAALVADGLHARTDGFTSLAVVVGAAGVALGWPLADPIVGLGITVAILFVLRDAAREIYRRLMDAVDPALVAHAEQVLRATPGVRDLAELRLRWIGHRLQAEVDVVVDRELSLLEAHDIAHDAEDRLIHEVSRLTRVQVHADPAP
jgi:cation diffusion facilitator family transporter